MKLARVEGLRPKRGTQVNYLELVWDASRPQFVLEPGSIGESREARAVEETMLELRMEMTEPRRSRTKRRTISGRFSDRLMRSRSKTARAILQKPR